MRRLLVVCIIALCAGISGTAPVDAQTTRAWFPGETLSYNVYFTFLRAGTSTFTVGPERTQNGQNLIQFKSVLQSTRGFFYRVFDDATSWADPNTYVSHRYEKVQRETEENSTNVTVFDHARGSAVRTENGTAHPAIPAARNTLDVLSAIYYVRSQPLRVGQTLSFPVHDGKRPYTMKVRVLKLERIRTTAGQFECLVVEPRLYQEDGTWKKKGQMTLWMTNDVRHVPVRIKMSLPFGALMADLQSIPAQP